MHFRIPTLRRHTNGVYFCEWGGRRRYFSIDQGASQASFLEELNAWSLWRDRQRRLRPRTGARSYTIGELTAMFLEVKETDTCAATRNYFRHHLGRFVRIWGACPGSVIDAAKLQALKTDMYRAMKTVGESRVRRWSDRTINHDLIAVKCLAQWSTDMGYIQPVNLRAVKKLNLPFPPDRSLAKEAVAAMVRLSKEGDPNRPSLIKDPRLEPWLNLCYLAALRPSEAVRLAARQGRFIEHGVFILNESKTMARSGNPRHIVLSDEALMWLEVARPHWSRLDSFSAAVVKACGPGGPHRLRHSAATHLHKAGVPRADVEIILGHLPARVSLIYNPINWQPLRAQAARLSL